MPEVIVSAFATPPCDRRADLPESPILEETFFDSGIPMLRIYTSGRVLPAVGTQFPMKKVLYTLIGAVLCVGTLAAQPVYVSPTGTGAGTSWADAASLQASLAAATDGTQLWLTGGSYLPTTCTTCTFSDREARFELRSGVSLYGGFAGTETTPDERVATNAPTVLSGDIDQDGTGANNSFTILYTQNVTAATTVDGVTFRGGRADVAQADADSPFASGGAWYNQAVLSGNNSSPTLRDCRFEDNYALRFGGAFYHHASFGGGGNVTMENCVFTANSSESDGGALYVEASFGGTATTTITGSTFTQNSAQLGKAGAIMNQGGENGFAELVLTDCFFSANTAFSNGGAVCNFGRNGNAGGTYTDCTFDANTAVFGAAVYNNGTVGGTSSPQIVNCDFVNGLGTNEGGAVYNNGFQGDASPLFSRCRFYGNTADGSGGALFNNGVNGIASPRIDRCDFRNNAVVDYGAAIYNFGKTMGNSSPVITNSLFYKNSATSAGAVYSLGSEFGNANPLFTNCTFVDNTASVGGAIYANGSDSTGTSAPVVTNCIFQGNEAPTGHIFRAISATITVRYSALDVSDCAAAWTGIDGNLVCESTVLYNVDPQFADAPALDFRLAAGSPLIDAGLNVPDQTGAFDLNGNDRIVDGTVDLGAYEYGTAVIQPTIFSSQPQSAALCAGAATTLTVSVTGAAPLTYQWYRNDTLLTGATAAVLQLSDVQATDAGTYYLAVTNGEGDVSNSQPATVTVQPTVFATATIAASTTSSCAGEAIQFTATVAGTGAEPQYTWLLNGEVIDGADSTDYITDALSDGDQISFVLTSTATCVADATVSTDTLTIGVQDTLTPAVSFTADFADTLCLDSLATFNAVATDAGSTPGYTWLLNGIPTGDTTAMYATTQLQDGDEVNVLVTSSAMCSTQLTVPAIPQIIAAQACSPPTALKELTELAVVVRPNPFTDRLLLRLPPRSEHLQLRLTDLRGRVLREQLVGLGTATLSVDTRSLSSGGYVLTLSGSTVGYRQLLIKL